MKYFPIMKNLFVIILFFPTILFCQSTGTGFAINSAGYIATNYHVIDGKDKLTVKGINGDYNKTYEATVVKTDKMNDLAILKLDVSFGSIPYGFKRSKEDVAASVSAIGYPLPELQGFEIKITTGIINSNSGLKDDPRWYQHSAPIQPGNSGGPLINEYGNIVGVNNAGVDNQTLRKQYGTETQSVFYAIKSRYLLNLMEDLDLPPLTTNKLSKLDLKQQFKQIKKFVYIITADSENNNGLNNISSKVNKINWVSLESAETNAKYHNKKMLIYFYKEDCDYCDAMQVECFNNVDVINYINANFIPVKIDGKTKEKIIFNDKIYTNQASPSEDPRYTWRHDFFANLVEPYKGNFYWPTTVILNGRLKKIKQLPGYKTKAQLLRSLR
tara:strand:- start:280 stop:1434 length:1155 start_codon:yes stop_codon:yes gene_type:complete